MKIQGRWNVYHCGLCVVEFAVNDSTDEGLTSCPKCESGEEVYLLNKDLIERQPS